MCLEEQLTKHMNDVSLSEKEHCFRLGFMIQGQLIGSTKNPPLRTGPDTTETNQCWVVTFSDDIK